MEKLPHQEYRDDLATKLREIRNSDPEEPKLAKAEAEGFLDAKRETSEYVYNKEAHADEIDITHATGRGVENNKNQNRKTLRELRLEYHSLDEYLRSSYKIYELLHIHLDNGYYDYEKKEFVKNIPNMEETHELIFTLIKCYYYEHEKKECFLPYESKLQDRNITFDLLELPIKLRQLLYKFYNLHVKKISEDKQLEQLKVKF